MSVRLTSTPRPVSSRRARARASAAMRSFWNARGVMCGPRRPSSPRRVAIIGKTSVGSGARRQTIVSNTSRESTCTSGPPSRLSARVSRASVVRAVACTGGERSSAILAIALCNGLCDGRRRPHLLAQRAPRPDLRAVLGRVALPGGGDRVGGRRDDARDVALGVRAGRRACVRGGGAVPGGGGALARGVGGRVHPGRGAIAGGSFVGARGGRVPDRRR